jgi:hypothetical protein
MVERTPCRRPDRTLKKQVLHKVGRPSFDHAVSHTKV